MYVRKHFDVKKLSPKEYFEDYFATFVDAIPQEIQETGLTFQFNILGKSGGTWVLDLGRKEVRQGRETADVIVESTDENFIRLTEGKLKADQAVSEHLLRIQGQTEHVRFFSELLSA